MLLKGIEEEVKLDQKYQHALTPEQDIAARYGWIAAEGYRGGGEAGPEVSACPHPRAGYWCQVLSAAEGYRGGGEAGPEVSACPHPRAGYCCQVWLDNC